MSSMSSCDRGEILKHLDAVLAWSKERDFRGHSKHDALNSPVLNALTLGIGPLQLLATQAVMRFPLNIRPLLGVPRRRNPKGIGLFAHACLDLSEELSSGGEDGGTRRQSLVSEASSLLSWLVAHASPQAGPSTALGGQFPPGQTAGEQLPSGERILKGLGWGYHYPWRDVGFFQPAHFPNRVVTCWIGFAFMRAFEVTGEDRFLLAAREAASFLLANPRRLTDTPEQLCLSYVPLEDISWAVMDVSALVGAFCARLASLGGEVEGFDPSREGRRLMNFVVDKQTDYGAWYYTWPAGDSHIRHDNYHTGIILDCLADYMTFSGDRGHEGSYREGLDYYRRHLFLESGAPRWMNDRTFPQDIHGAAAGILTFSRAALYCQQILGEGDSAVDHLSFASRILKWTMENLYNRRGYFFYQKTRWMTKRFCLMRWCNAWMSRAMAALLLTESRISSVAGKKPEKQAR
jgi:hypothetical protein